MTRNLVPGQYQLGNLVFGRGTQIKMSKFEVMPYDVQNQDFQVSRADQKRFGFDQISPTTINMTMGVLKNYIRENAYNPLGVDDSIFAEFPKLGDIRREWRDPSVRRVWGQMKPLYVCGHNDGIVRTIWGRPGQFTYARPAKGVEWLECLGEFRCAETVAYREQESFITRTAATGWNTTFPGTGGDAETWIRVLFQGPMVNPKLMLGSMELGLTMTIAAGRTVELSGYPWQRRVVDNAPTPLNHRTKTTLNTPYLDKLQIPYATPASMVFTATGTTSASAYSLRWHDAFEIIE